MLVKHTIKLSCNVKMYVRSIFRLNCGTEETRKRKLAVGSVAQLKVKLKNKGKEILIKMVLIDCLIRMLACVTAYTIRYWISERGRACCRDKSSNSLMELYFHDNNPWRHFTCKNCVFRGIPKELLRGKTRLFYWSACSFCWAVKSPSIKIYTMLNGFVYDT